MELLYHKIRGTGLTFRRRYTKSGGRTDLISQPQLLWQLGGKDLKLSLYNENQRENLGTVRRGKKETFTIGVAARGKGKTRRVWVHLR